MTHFPESFTRSEKWLLQTAIVMGYAITPVDRYYNHNDFFLDSEIDSCFESGERIRLSCEELKDLRSKPALTMSVSFSNNFCLTRLTKAGWKKAYELAYRWIEETESWYVYDGKGEEFWLRLDNI